MKFKQKIYPWLVMLSCCGFAAATLGTISNCAGLFFQPVSQDLHTGVGSISLYLTILTLVAGLSAPVLVKLLKKYNIRWLASGGAVLATLGTLAMAYCQKPYQFYIAAVFVGFGYAAINVIPINLLLGNWFKKNLGTITGLTLSFSGLFGALFNPLFNRVITSLGWRTGFLMMALLVGLLTLPGAFTIIRLKPEELGLQPYGATNQTDPTTGTAESASTTPTTTPSRQSITVLYLFAIATSIVISFGYHLAGYGTASGLGSATGALMATWAMLGNVTSKLLLGILCDKLGTVKSLLLYGIILIAGITGLIFINAAPSVLTIIGPAAFGLVYACSSVGIPLLVKATVSPDRFATVYSTCAMLNTCFTAIFISVEGTLFDLTSSYLWPLFITMFCTILIMVSILLRRQKTTSPTN